MQIRLIAFAPPAPHLKFSHKPLQLSSFQSTSTCHLSIFHARQSTNTKKHQSFNSTMGLRAVDNFDGSFQLDDTVKSALERQLRDPRFTEEIAIKTESGKVEFIGKWFQPVPYSQNTPRGMPRSFEIYMDDPNFLLINIPPTVMFEARCSKPSRLTAVFRRTGLSEIDLQRASLQKQYQKERQQHAASQALNIAAHDQSFSSSSYEIGIDDDEFNNKQDIQKNETDLSDFGKLLAEEMKKDYVYESDGELDDLCV